MRRDTNEFPECGLEYIWELNINCKMVKKKQKDVGKIRRKLDKMNIMLAFIPLNNSHRPTTLHIHFLNYLSSFWWTISHFSQHRCFMSTNCFLASLLNSTAFKKPESLFVFLNTGSRMAKCLKQQVSLKVWTAKDEHLWKLWPHYPHMLSITCFLSTSMY